MPIRQLLYFVSRNLGCSSILILCFFFKPSLLCGQIGDSGVLLKKVTVTAYKKSNDVSAVDPVQYLNKAELEKLNSVSVADALKYFSGVMVKDYGGIGGLKTISVRSLGANHTGVMYDGIMVGDAQGGQIDLGRYSLQNIESIQLFSLQAADILVPARTFASASVLALTTSSPHGSPRDLTMSIRSGSFGFIDPAFSLHGNIGKGLHYGISAEYQSADGKYSFTDYETGKKNNKRENSDIQTYRIESDVAYHFNDSNKIRFKIYYYDSKRGLPGSVILYNTASDDRLNNYSFFMQSSWQKNISPNSRLLINAKYSLDNKDYLDPSYPNAAGKLENKFRQQEFYASAAYRYEVKPHFALTYAADYFNSTLERKDIFAINFAAPTRNSFLNNVAFVYKDKRLDVTGNLLHTNISEKVLTGSVPNSFNKFAPGIAASLQPFNYPLRFRASYKNIFRPPTFDDLYYTNVGNTGLRPEYADQFNVGLTFSGITQRRIQEVTLTVDAYHNRVTDKIIAVPRQNLFQWTILNIGIVDIKGVDLSGHFVMKQWKDLHISTNISYTYQKALDLSDRSSTVYKTQLPYTPEHSGSINSNIEYKNTSLSYNILLSSYRYRLGDLIPANLLEKWATQHISLAYQFSNSKKKSYKFITELNNIFNRQYEVIKYYPMPRFNYRIGIIANFKK